MAKKLDEKLAERQQAPQHAPTVNPEVEAKIAAFKQSNPARIAYFEGLPKDRLVNIAVLRDIAKQESAQRYRNSIDEKLEKWVSTRPEIADKIAKAVASLPAERAGVVRSRMLANAFQAEGLAQFRV